MKTEGELCVLMKTKHRSDIRDGSFGPANNGIEKFRHMRSISFTRHQSAS
jgi:hypothetical protein